MKFKKLAFVASDTPEAQEALAGLKKRYDGVEPEAADVIVALGGDGLMIQMLHQHIGQKLPIYGMNRGSVGFLMNEYHEADLMERLDEAEQATIHPLRMDVTSADGSKAQAFAINEVAMLRETYQAAKLRLSINGKVRMTELICDGVLVSTPAGSTAYNLSVHGPIIPINAKLLALTPISPFRPRRWRGALLDHKAEIRIQVLEAAKRPASAVADDQEFRNVVDVHVKEDEDTSLYMLFDAGRNLDERILAEQFLP